MSWYRTYRPQTFASLHITPVREAFLKILSTGQFSHAYLLSGPKGTGKTSAARILAKVLNCEKNEEVIRGLLGSSEQRIANSKKKSTRSSLSAPNSLYEPCNECPSCLAITKGTSMSVTELDAASNRGIDDIRSLRERIGLSVPDGLISVFIIDEVHMLTTEAFNALLKVIEEPPAHVVFVLATTDPQKMPATVVSRCTQIVYRKASAPELALALEGIAKAESLSVTSEVITALAASADGSFRDAVKLFETLALGKTTLGIEDLETIGQSQGELVRRLLLALLAKDSVQVVEVFAQLETLGMDGTAFQREVLRRAHERLVEYAKANDARLSTVAALLKAIAVPIEPSVPIAWMPFEVACLEYAMGGSLQTNPPSLTKSSAEVASSAKRKVQSSKLQGNDQNERDIHSTPTKTATPPVRKQEVPEDKTTPKETHENGGDNVEENPESTTENRQPKTESIVEFASVQSQWPAVLFQVKAKSVPVEGLLRATAPLRVDGSTLVCQANYQFHKEQLELDRNRHVVEEVLESILGSKLQIEFVTGVKVTAAANSPHSNISGAIPDDPLVAAVSEALL